MAIDGNPREWFDLGPFTVFDVETTGMSPASDMIVEIAAQRIETDGTGARFQSLVNPKRSIPPQASRVHRITDDMVAGQPGFLTVGQKFLEFAAGSTLVAHNARFDLGFLQESLNREGLKLWDGKTMDTIPLARRAFPELPSYSLPNLRLSLGLGDETTGAHRAAADVEMTVELLRITLNTLIRLSG